MILYQLPPQNHLYSDPSEDQIENIMRKGGFLVPDPPTYDPLLQQEPFWESESQTWVVVDKSINEAVEEINFNMATPQATVQFPEIIHPTY